MSENSEEHVHSHHSEEHGHHHAYHSHGDDQSSQMYMLAFAFLIGAALLSASVFFSMSSVSSAVDGLSSTIAQKSFTVSAGAAGSGSAAAPTAAPSAAPSAAPTPSQPTKVANIDTTGRPMRGNASAPVTVVEFADFQCPFCQAAYPTVKQLESDYKGKIKLYYMEFPLTSLHPYAEKAAQAAECANAQGKFWQYYDTLFTNKTLDVPSLKQHAADLGLDTSKFNSCLDSGQMAANVSAQEQMGSSLGVSGTPTFFINGKMLVGAQPYSAFKSAIDAALAG